MPVEMEEPIIMFRYCQKRIERLLNFAKHKKCFTIVGPEIPLIAE